VLTTPDGVRLEWAGVRAPALWRPAPPVWGTPIQLFNGADLAGWRVIQGDVTWEVVDGVLRNATTGGNLVTERAMRRPDDHPDNPDHYARHLIGLYAVRPRTILRVSSII
jgi:hypothetical protein